LFRRFRVRLFTSFILKKKTPGTAKRQEKDLSCLAFSLHDQE